jgi:hypothetical protein
MKKSKAELRAEARYRAKAKTENVLELADLVRLAAGAATNIVFKPSGHVERDIATKVADVLHALHRALRAADDAALDELHAAALRQLGAQDFWSDYTNARYRLKKGGKANLRADALELVRGAKLEPGPLDARDQTDRGARLRMLAERLSLIAGHCVPVEKVESAFPNGWTADDETNAVAVLTVALGSPKQARDAVYAAKDAKEARLCELRAAEEKRLADERAALDAERAALEAERREHEEIAKQKRAEEAAKIEGSAGEHPTM